MDISKNSVCHCGLDPQPHIKTVILAIAGQARNDTDLF